MVRVLDPITSRAEEVAWIVDYLPDLESDFAAHYGIHDPWTLPGDRFCRLAERTVAYRGVMHARARALMDDEDQPQPAPRQAARVAAPRSPAGRTGAGDQVREFDVTDASSVQGIPELASMIEWTKA